MKTPTGYVVYKGKSLLNGDNIVVIVILNSRNKKTGNMVQTYILPDNEYTPYKNSILLKDESVCGICPQRQGLGGGCYVDLIHGPSRVYVNYKKGKYPYNVKECIDNIKGRYIRLGSYGDPAAVPKYVWNNLLSVTLGHTGYTHQWKNNKAIDIKDIIMASVDTEKEFYTAKKLGYRTFRIRQENQPLLKSEFVCPASIENNNKLNCNSCKACNGSKNPNKGNPVIIQHGRMKNRVNASNGLSGLNQSLSIFDPIINIFNKLLYWCNKKNVDSMC